MSKGRASYIFFFAEWVILNMYFLAVERDV